MLSSHHALSSLEAQRVCRLFHYSGVRPGDLLFGDSERQIALSTASIIPIMEI